MEFLKTPYLPKTRAILGIGDISVPGVETITPFENNLLPPSMRRHGDLSFCYLGDGVAVVSPQSFLYYSERLKKTGIKIIKGQSFVGSNYPQDCAYNVCVIGERLFCRRDITDPTILKTAEDMGYDIISIKQGYAKCSVCPVDPNSAISADPSFYKEAKTLGLDVLLITNDNISLKGFKNGFFGGSAFMEAKNILRVNGDLKESPDYQRIKSFLEKRNIQIRCTKGSITDFGSFIPVIEE